MVLVKEIGSLRQELKTAQANRAMSKARSKRFSGDKALRASKDSSIITGAKHR